MLSNTKTNLPAGSVGVGVGVDIEVDVETSIPVAGIVEEATIASSAV